MKRTVPFGVVFEQDSMDEEQMSMAELSKYLEMLLMTGLEVMQDSLSRHSIIAEVIPHPPAVRIRNIDPSELGEVGGGQIEEIADCEPTTDDHLVEGGNKMRQIMLWVATITMVMIGISLFYGVILLFVWLGSIMNVPPGGLFVTVSFLGGLIWFMKKVVVEEMFND